VAGLLLPNVVCIESDNKFGRFVAEPLEKGFGVTLGNSLRRVLLGSLTSAAISAVEITGIQHEFSVIPHAREDTIGFLLNIKEICIRSLSQREGTMTLQIDREGEVVAGDIKTTSDFEVVNPELHLITLDSSKANLDVKFYVKMGRGYVPAGSSDGMAPGIIPIDAIYTPVRNANFVVESIGLEDGSEKEKMTLEIWTNGTLSPLEALTQSAAILVDQFACFRNLAKSIADENGEPPWTRLLPPEQYTMRLEDMNLSTHTYNSLRRGSITTLGELLEKASEGDLSSLAGFGAKSQEEVEEVLQNLNLPFVPEIRKKAKKKDSDDISNDATKEEEQV